MFFGIRDIGQIALVQCIAENYRLAWPKGYSPISFRIASSSWRGEA